MSILRTAVVSPVVVALVLGLGCKEGGSDDERGETEASSTSSSSTSESSTASESSTSISETSEAESGDPETSETESGGPETETETETETTESESESESEEGGMEPCAGPCGTPDCGTCPDAPMIEGQGYRIDQTEVTIADYSEFLDREYDPIVLDPTCSWKPDFGWFVPESWDDQLLADPEFPVSGVDWCDADAYCRWAGKRLCANIGGGPADFEEVELAEDEWFQACSAGGTQDYPYGDNYEALACNGWALGVEDLVPVGTLPACQGGLDDLHDMSGNVWEWTAACTDEPGLEDFEQDCRRRGGSYYTNDGDLLRCGVKSRRVRSYRSFNTGIRCCATP